VRLDSIRGDLMANFAPRRVLTCLLFGLGWVMTILLPMLMLLVKAEFHQSLEETLVFSFLIGRAISTHFLRTLLIGSFALSDRVAQLERELMALRGSERQLDW
jgi:hypothetical protein